MEVVNGSTTNDDDIPPDYEDKAMILFYLSSEPHILTKYSTSQIMLEILG